jgi:hypothetical protein
MWRTGRPLASFALVLLLGVPAAAQPPLPDFAITDFGFTSVGVLEATLHNYGGFATNFMFEVNLYNANGNIKLQRFRSLEVDKAMTLRNGGTQRRVQLLRTLLPPGTYHFALVIDDGNAVAESDETNNRVEFTTTIASKLTVASVTGRTLRDASGTKAVVTAIVQNRGTTSNEWDGTRCVLRAESPEGIQEFDLGILKPTESRTLSIPTVLPSLKKMWAMTIGHYAGAGNFIRDSDMKVVPTAAK